MLNHILRTYYLEVKRGSQIKDWETEKVILIFLYAEPHNLEQVISRLWTTDFPSANKDFLVIRGKTESHFRMLLGCRVFC